MFKDQSIFRRFHRLSGVLGTGIMLLMTVGSMAQDGANLPTRGKRFWTGFMQNGFGAQSLRVHVVGTNATSGTVSIPLTGWSTTFSVAANGVAVIAVPITAENWGSGTVQNKGVLIQTQDSVNVFTSSFQNFTHDISQVLPVNALGNSYRVDSYQGLPNFNNLHKSELLIVATEDGTQVQITPSVNTLSGNPAGSTFTVDLNAGQCYQVQAAFDYLDLTGTVVEATSSSGSCRPFVVIGGSTCATAPGGCSACDAIFEQLVPRNTWGTRYFTVPIQGVTGNTYRIMADQDNTVVTIGTGSPITLNAGQRHEVNGSNTPVCIQASKPVSVVQLMEGYSCAGNGDPSLFLLSRDDRRSTSALFHTPTSAQISQHSISLVVEPASVGEITLDGAIISPGLFQTYAGCSDRRYAKLNVSAGVHSVQSATGFQLYSFGMGYGESYATSVHDIRSYSVQQDSTVCGSGPVTLNAPEPLTNAIWTAASAPNTTIGTGNSLTIAPTASESYTVTGVQALTGCPRSFTYNVGVPLTIPTLLSANEETTINICQYEPVQLNLSPPPDPAWFDIQWGPASALDDATIANPLAMPMTDTWFTVSVTSPSGCGNMTDSVFVGVTPGSILDLVTTTSNSAMCLGDSAQLSSQALRVIASDGFNGPPGSMWTAIQGGTTNTACGSASGSALYFNGNGQRLAQTIGLNTIGGGELRFQLKIANGSPPCEDAEPGEDVRLEFSTNNGFSWTTMNTYSENGYPAFTQIIAPIPLAAQTTNTMFRLRQLSNSGTGQDNWAIDDLLVARYDNNWLSYSWSPGTVANSNGASTMAYPTASGWYVLSGTDPQAGCVYSDSVHIQVDPAFTLTVTDATTLCDAAGIQLSAIPSFVTPITWSWAPDNGSLSATNLANPLATPTSTTTYSVQAVTDIGCIANAQVTLTVGQLLDLTVAAASDTICQGQSTLLMAQASGANGLNYSWTGAGLNNSSIASPTASPSQTTTYTCTVTDTNSGCSLTESVTVVVNTGYLADAGSDLTVCSALGVQLNVQHNVPDPIYSWSPPANLNSAVIQSPSITNDVSTTYIVTVSDQYGCSVSDQITVTRAFDGLPAQLNASACANTPPLLSSPQVGTGYLWSTGAVTPSITPPSSGSYSLTITDASGCQGTTNFNVILFPVPVVDLGSDLSLCGTTSQVLNAGNPGSTFLWNTNATTQQITVSSTGTYSATVTNSNGCSASDAVSVQFNALPVDVLQDVTACITTPPTLDAGNPGSTYQWAGGANTQTVTATVSGTYSVTVTTPQNCSATFNAVVNLMPEVFVDLGNDTTLCEGSSLILDAGNPGNTNQWSTGQSGNTITVSQAGNYSVTSNNGYCSGGDMITVSIAPSPTDELEDVEHCIDDPVQLDAGNQGSSFQWSNGEITQVIDAPTSGTYSVEITNSLGCSATYDSDVSYTVPPVVDLGADTVLCDGRTLVLDAGDPVNSFTWNTGATSSTIPVTGPGTYSVAVRNGPCERSDSIIVRFNPTPQRMMEEELFICFDEEPGYVTLDAGNGGSVHLWNTGESTQEILVDSYGWYFVDISNRYGCTLNDSIRVNEFCPSTIFIPNTFTPNGDGINDVFLPIGRNIAALEIRIFDRWGTLLFESNDPDIGWDGTYRGEIVKNDMYAWRMRYRFQEKSDGTLGREHQQLGHIQVLR